MKSIVVGLDGTQASDRALAWAARAVGPHGTIHAVTAISPVTELVVDAALGDSIAYVDRLRTELEDVWARPARELVATVTARAHEGSAAAAIASEARDRDADAIAVGVHVSPPLVPRTIGATTRHLLKALPAPLVVVPESWRPDHGGRDPVVVGIGHGDATDAAVRWAARFAEVHRLGLGLVRAIDERLLFRLDGLLDLMAYYIDPSQRDVWTHEDLCDLARDAQAATDTTIEIGATAVRGNPATRLVEAGLAASLLVIGRHRSCVTGASRSTRPLRHALTNARCPVAIVPATATG